jgi:hypothetical protein
VPKFYISVAKGLDRRIDRPLKWQANLPEQRLKARIGAQGIEKRIDLEIGEGYVVRLAGFLQPLERLIVFLRPA